MYVAWKPAYPTQGWIWMGYFPSCTQLDRKHSILPHCIVLIWSLMYCRDGGCVEDEAVVIESWIVRTIPSKFKRAIKFTLCLLRASRLWFLESWRKGSQHFSKSPLLGCAKMAPTSFHCLQHLLDLNNILIFGNRSSQDRYIGVST